MLRSAYLSAGGPKLKFFEKRAAQSPPAGTKQRFLVRFDSKTGGNLGEDQKKNLHYTLMRFLPEF